jgi:hypothetical protein
MVFDWTGLRPDVFVDSDSMVVVNSVDPARLPIGPEVNERELDSDREPGRAFDFPNLDFDEFMGAQPHGVEMDTPRSHICYI